MVTMLFYTQHKYDYNKSCLFFRDRLPHHISFQDPTSTGINANFTLGLYGCHVGITDGMELKSTKLMWSFMA
jgi:hypothetical protein